MPNPVYRHASDLPKRLMVFPLPGALLFPRWQLPLNIFEPRYLNMVDDALAGDRLIGMVQSFGGPKHAPILADVGCVGRITTFSETDDGRYLITLYGISRFRIGEELKTRTPYRQVAAEFASFEADMYEPDETGLPAREAIEAALRDYARAKKLTADWTALDAASLETVTNALSAGCPFTALEKQALLEAENGLKGRIETLIALLQMGAGDDEGGPVQ